MANQPLTTSDMPSTVWSPHTHADLKLPNGSVCGSCPTEQLRSMLGRLGVPDAHTAPRLQIIDSYARMLKRIHEDAGSAAVDAWLAGHRG
jgi:hypothetical protein